LEHKGSGQCPPALPCALGGQLPLPGLAEYVAKDVGHVARVQACFLAEGPDSMCWTQEWPGIGRVNHLTWSFELLEGDADPSQSPDHVSATAASAAPVAAPAVAQPAHAPAPAPAHAAATAGATLAAASPAPAAPEMQSARPGPRTAPSVGKADDPWFQGGDPWARVQPVRPSVPSRVAAAAPETVPARVAAAAAETIAPAEQTPQVEIAAQRAVDNTEDEWQPFQDPSSGQIWYYNERTGEARWTECPPTRPTLLSADLARKKAEVARLIAGDDSDSLSEHSGSQDGGPLRRR